MGEVGAVDDDERVGPAGDDRLGGLADAREQRRQPREHRQDAHDRDVADRKQALQPLGLHRLAADAGKGDVAAGRAARSARISLKPSWSPECSPATRATRSGLTARSQPKAGDEQARRVGARGESARDRRSAPRPRRSPRPRSSARAARLRSSSGPTAGMSSRRSCPRLGALTSTPAAALQAQPAAGAQLGDAGEHRVGAFGRLDREHPAARRRPRPARRRKATARRAGARRSAMSASSSRRGARRAERPDRRQQLRREIVRRRPSATPSRSKNRGDARRADRCRRRETAARARRRACTAPQSSRRSANSGPRHRADDRHLGDRRAPSARRTACRPRPSAPRHAEGLDRRRRSRRRRRSGTARGRARARFARRPRAETRRRRRGSPEPGGCAAAAARPLTPPRPCPSRGTQIARSPPCAQEGDDLLHRLLVGEGGRRRRRRAPSACPSRGEQHLVGAPQLVDRLVREAAPLQADEIEAGERGAVAERDAERDDVVLDPREAADEGVRADADELMRRRAAAENREIADLAMAGRASRCWRG